MQREQEWKQIKREYREVEIPQNGTGQVLEAMVRAKRQRSRWKRISKYGTVAAAAFLLFILPNTNAMVADAMGGLPVVGGFFRVVTIANYSVSNESDGMTMDVMVPNLEASTDTAWMEEKLTSSVQESLKKDLGSINTEMKSYVETLMTEFQVDLEEDGYGSLDISYEVVTDTEEWFSIKLYAETVMASGYSECRCFTVDKVNGKQLLLEDILAEQENAEENINKEILSQMQDRMKNSDEVYFYFTGGGSTADTFTGISGGQNFYINEEGLLVIVFNEAEVAPAFMGIVEFIIPEEIVSLRERGE